MNIENLRGFMTVAQTLNFRSAAEKLFISQPTLSRQIAELEKELGAPLLVRTTRSVSLTDAGQDCLEGARGIIATWDAMHRLARKERGILRLGVYANRTTYYIASAMERFRAEHPELQIGVITDTAQNLCDKLNSGEIDLLCMMGPAITGMPDTERIVLAEEHPSVMLPLNHSLAGRSKIHPTELAGEKFLMHTPQKSSAMYEKLLEIFTSQGVTPTVAGTSDNDALLVTRIISGEAVGLFPSDWGVKGPAGFKDEPAGTVLVHLDCDNAAFARVAAWKKGNENPARIAFVRILQEELAH